MGQGTVHSGADLTYALQRGGPWQTVRNYPANRYEFSFVQKVMVRGCAMTPGKRWRILLMPFNVLADETGIHRETKMEHIEVWGKWHSLALAAGVGAEVAALGRSVVRDYWQHGHDQDEAAGGGPHLGADRHHAMMIALAKQKPALAIAVFQHALGQGSPQESELDQALHAAERLFADSTAREGMPEWYQSAYALDGCVWNLYPTDDIDVTR